MKKELYLQTEEPLEVREVEGEPSKITGYAAVFNRSIDLFWFSEEVAPGAFSRSLVERPDVLALWDHDTAHPIGRHGAGTLSLREDEKGLLVEITPPATTMGRDSLELVRTGHVTGMSFGFRVIEDKITVRNGKEHRTLTDVDLYEISVVTFPAYQETSAEARTLLPALSKRYLNPAEVFAEIETRNQELFNKSRKNRLAWMSKRL